MPHSGNRWIITSHKFREHKTIDAALAELKRIQSVSINPNKYRLVRIKRTTHDPACSIYQDNNGPPRCNCPMGAYEEHLASVAEAMAAS